MGPIGRLVAITLMFLSSFMPDVTQAQEAQDLADHPLPQMIEAGLLVTINSDDPAYFGGYIGDNYLATAAALESASVPTVTMAASPACRARSTTR